MAECKEIVEALLRQRVAITDSCWIWTGYTKPSGYGQVTWRGKRIRAHRMFYVAFKGEIPEGLVIDHLCRVKRCVNPDHLEAVTQKVNVRRGSGSSIANQNAAKVVCIHGHPLEEGHFWRRNDGARLCKTCAKARKQKYRERRRA